MALSPVPRTLISLGGEDIEEYPGFFMSKPVNCRYFYGDYHRGKNKEECRLIEANRDSPRPWQRKHCDSCPVPELLIASNSRDLLLEGEVQRVFFRERVKVTFAVCSKHVVELDNPQHCPECALE